MTDQIHIVDSESTTTTTRTREETRDVEDVTVQAPSHYQAADPINLFHQYEDEDERVDRFVRALADELGKGELVTDVCLLDSLDVDQTNDVDLADLMVLPDESLMFIGSDPTTRDASPLFGFIIEPTAPIPAPTTAQDALDLLRPEDVRAAFQDEDEPARQGEWWLLPTQKVPVGSTFTPGVNSRPFGPSPLDNHVPREWGMTTPDVDFMMNVERLVEELPDSITTPPEVIEWLHRQHRRVPTPEYVPEWQEIQDIAGEILVRGTLRHRENDHFVEQLGDTWHTVETHDMDVYTADSVIDRVVLD